MTERRQRPCRAGLAAVALLSIVAATAPAHAHSFSMAYSDVRVHDDRSSATYELRIGFADLAEPLALATGEPSDSDVERNRDRLFRYVTERIEMEGDGERCDPVPQSLEIDSKGDKFVRLTWTCSWPARIDVFAIEYDLFFEIDPNHTGLIKVRYANEVATAQLLADSPRFEWELGEPPPQDTLGYVLSGVDHILYGPDHILFLLGLLLIAAITRDGAGPWQTRHARPALRYTLAIVTSFTVAHSITLIAAAMSWVTLPRQLVESLIAISIVWVAIENLVISNPQRRWILTFAFGLGHGMGFAAMLTPLLPESQVVVPLLAFNVGVELGQLTIVALSLPVLSLIAARAGAARYRWWVVVPGSIAVGLMGALWLAERAFGV